MTAGGNWREEYRSQAVYTRLMATGCLSVSRLILTSAGDFARLRQTKPSEEHYVRPLPCYQLPRYDPSMPVCRSKEKYLHPTRFCSSHAPEVIALAHSLGAYRLPDREFAQAAFEFAKEQLLLEILPIDAVEDTLRRGSGTCFHLISVFIALCRAAGIRARYKMFSMKMIQAWRETLIDPDPLAKKWYDALGYFVLEGEGEAFVDGRWTVAHVGPTAARQAAAGLPISRFGEDSIGSWFMAHPGTIMRFEALPAGLASASRLLHRLAPGSLERINVSIQHQTARGDQVLAEMGGPLAYDSIVRRSMGPQMPEVTLKPRNEILFSGANR
jgi:hypothetical protein